MTRPAFFILSLFFSLGICAQQTMISPSSWSIKDPFVQKVFVENKGQFTLPENISSAPVLYGHTNGDLTVYLTARGVVYSYHHIESKKHDEEENWEDIEKEFNEPPPVADEGFVLMEWGGGSSECLVEAVDSVSFYYSYGINESGTMKPLKAAAYKKIVYRNIYPGIDAEYFFTDSSGFKYNLIVHPGANAGQITMKYSNAQIKTDARGNLISQAKFGEIVDHAPVSFIQETNRPIKTSFVTIENNVLFAHEDYDRQHTLVIDPWVYSTSFNGTNAAYDVEYDLDGNVYCYGGSYPFQEMKFSKEGWLLWTFSTFAFQSSYPYYGDFAVDPISGSSYIIEGFNGGKIIKLNNAGSFIAFFSGSPMFRELWRCVYNNCTKTLLIGGSSWSTSFSYQVARIDTNLQTLVPVNIISAPSNEGTHDVALLAIDNAADCYMLVAESAMYPNSFDNVLVKADAATLFPPDYIINSGHNFPESGYLGGYGGDVIAGMNGMAVNKKYLYTYDGSFIQRRNKSTGALLSSATIGSLAYNWGGLAVDDCGSVFAGVGNLIMMYDSAFNVLSSITTPDKVYDVRIGADNMLYASGKNFVAAYKLLIPPCMPFNLYFKYEPCATVASVTVTVTGGTEPYTFSWFEMPDTTNYLENVGDGIYFMTVTDASCIPRRLEYPVPVSTQKDPFTSVVYEDSLCAGEQLKIAATGAVSYQWSTGATTSSIIQYPSTSTTYSLVSVSDKGCTDTIFCTVLVFPSPMAGIEGADTICAGDTVPLRGYGGYFHEWSTGETTDTIWVAPASTTNYNYYALNEACADTAQITLFVRKSNAYADVVKSDGFYSELVAYGGGSYQWFPSYGLSCDTCAYTGLQHDTTYFYCVAVTDTNGCRDTACVTVGLTTIYVPNAFTPNNNSLNEVFKPVVNQVLDYHLIIFNRWGEEVFETTNTEEGWDGNSNGGKCQEDVYVYKIRFKDKQKEEEHEYNGKLILIR